MILTSLLIFFFSRVLIVQSCDLVSNVQPIIGNPKQQGPVISQPIPQRSSNPPPQIMPPQNTFGIRPPSSFGGPNGRNNDSLVQSRYIWK